jgi:hypothetical protein
MVFFLGPFEKARNLLGSDGGTGISIAEQVVNEVGSNLVTAPFRVLWAVRQYYFPLVEQICTDDQEFGNTTR